MDLLTARHTVSFYSLPARSKYLIAAVIVGLVMVLNASWMVQIRDRQRVQGTSTTLSTSEIIALTNLERAKKDLPALVPNDLLTQAAMDKAQNMIRTGVFDHYYQTEEGANVNPWQFILDQGYEYHHAGENLARDFFDAEVLVQAWMDSPAHKANILSEQYKEIGVAVVDGPFFDRENTTLVVQLFAAPLPEGLVVVEREGFDEIKVTPVLESEAEQLDQLFSTYPPILIAVSVALLIVAIGTVFFDIFYFHLLHRQNLHPPSKELWRH